MAPLYMRGDARQRDAHAFQRRHAFLRRRSLMARAAAQRSTAAPYATESADIPTPMPATQRCCNMRYACLFIEPRCRYGDALQHADFTTHDAQQAAQTDTDSVTLSVDAIFAADSHAAAHALL